MLVGHDTKGERVAQRENAIGIWLLLRLELYILETSGVQMKVVILCARLTTVTILGTIRKEKSRVEVIVNPERDFS